MKKTLQLSSGSIVGTGWLPPLPDLRDYTPENKVIKALDKKLGVKPVKALPASVDLRKWCSPVEDQGALSSCTAQAGIGIVEYYEKRAFKKRIEGSSLFLYKTTRNLMQITGDKGAYIRSTMGALVLCGVPDEKYWPYNIDDFDVEPPVFVYSIADNFETLTYFCHDPVSKSKSVNRGQTTIDSVKKYLEAGVPAMFGFYGFQSYDQGDVKGAFPYPCENESAEWGHAVVAIGYDDNMKIKNLSCGSETTGAIRIRNSWGKDWGDKGYGWLPYEYVINGLADDFWSLISMEWVDSGQFGN